MNTLIINATTATGYTTREETLDGKAYLVVPVVMMTHGVHSGSKGPVLHEIAELGKYIASWNGIPLTVNHPKQSGTYVSANIPEVLQEYAVGRVFNARVQGQKLKAEAWIDIEKITEVSPDALEYIQTGKPLDVSVGIFSDEEATEGTWNGETYSAVARNYRPDHLALLPGGVGACSWADGCGIRNNSANNQKGGNDVKNELKTDGSPFGHILSQVAEAGRYTIQVNAEESLMGRLESIRNALYQYNSKGVSYYLVEAYDTYVIYQVFRSADALGGPSEKYYRQTYEVGPEGVVTFTGQSTEVLRTVTYTDVPTNMQRTIPPIVNQKKEETEMSVNEKSPCFIAKVDRLITHSSTRFAEADREWLMAQPEEMLERMLPIEAPAPEVNTVFDAAKAIEVLQSTYQKAEDYLAVVPDAYKESFANGLRLHNEERERKVSEIQANAAEVWTKEELEGMSMDTLTKIHKSSIKQPGNYIAQGGAAQRSVSNEVAPMLPIGVE